MQKILEELNLIKKGLKQQAKLKELEIRRAEWERQNALFVPSKQRLERGRKALDLGEDYNEIKNLRSILESSVLKQNALRNDLTEARNSLQNAEQSLTLIEAEVRDKLAEQTKLTALTKKVKVLDEQISDRQKEVSKIRAEHLESEKKLREYNYTVDKSQSDLERIELNLREAKKFLQTHASDEKLSTGIGGIQKCYSLYDQAYSKGIDIKDSYAAAIKIKQAAQNKLNDRSQLITDITHKFELAEKNYVRARAFYESSLKGRSLNDWQDICDRNVKKLSELDALYKKFQEEHALHESLNHLQDVKKQIQQETKNLSLRDVEQSGRINELQLEVQKLERRVNLLKRIEDLDAVRELLQDGIACPLCGSLTHPYVSGALIPNPEELHKNLFEAQKSLENLHRELDNRQTQAGKLSEEFSNLGHDENEIREKINEINSEISIMVSNLGIQMGAGISPFDEIDKARQKTRDQLQLARNAYEIAEAAQRDLKIAGDELDKITKSRDELTRYHQEALFVLNNSRADENRLDSESRTQEEIINSLKRELISQIAPYGYKALPDKNPEQVVKDLEERLQAWQDGVKKSDALERESVLANTNLNDLKKMRDSEKLKCDDLAMRLRSLEAERDTLQQQRIVLFASRDPDLENEKMSHEIENIKQLSEERRELKISITKKLDDTLNALHTLETETATNRDMLQKYEIAFSKKLLELGFKSEDDYLSACLKDEERKTLQDRLKELTAVDLELNAETENARADLLELHGGFNAKDFSQKIAEIEKQASQELAGDDEALNQYDNMKPEIKELAAQCGLPEVFLN